MGSTTSRLRPSVHPGPLHFRLPTSPRCSSSSSYLKELQSWRTSPHPDHRERRVVLPHADGGNTPLDGLGVHGMVGSRAAVAPSEVMRTSRGRSVTRSEVIMARPELELKPWLLNGCADSAGRYKVVPSVVCSMCCLFGVIYCFFGYRCFKAVMFLTGLMFGSVVIFMLCYKERVLDTQLSVEASVGIGLGIGTLCGLVTMLVRSVGLFMVGLLLGLLVAVATLVGMEELSHSPPRSVWVPLGVLLGLGMLFAVLTLQWQRIFTTLSTAVFGAAVITVALDYFVELFALVLYMYERMKAVPGKPVCWLTWVVLGVWPALTLLGVVVQWKVTAEGYSHTKVIISRQQRRMQVMRIRQRDDRYRHKKKKKKHLGSSSNQNQAKQLHQDHAYRRKPNPIRRYDTDVLSPSYIQNFRDRQVQAQPFPGQLLGGPHAAVDLGYDSGSTAPFSGATGPLLRA